MRKPPFSSRLAHLLLVACAGLAPLSLALPAEACGGLFCARNPVDQTGEKILFASDGHTVTAHVQIQYEGEASKFGWILPVPTAPKLSVGSDTVFASLLEATRPQFELSIKDEGPCEPRPPGTVYDSAVPAPMTGGLGHNQVTVVSQEQVGPYDTVVLQANDPGVLKAWLRKNDYVIPPKLDPLLDPYVAGKYSFVALKLTKNRSAGDIQPIVLTYKAAKAGIPLRLTGVAAAANMDIRVWVLGAHRAVPENYRHLLVNEARIDWETSGANYADVVKHAVAEAGGQAFVTEFAGNSAVVPTAQFTRERFHLEQLAHLTEPVPFAQAIVDDGFFGQRYGQLNQDSLVAFLKKYIRKPHSLAKEPDISFFRNLTDHQEALNEAGVKVDARAAAAELEQRIVEPAVATGTLFRKFPYLTGLYTTMSPADMTQDPTFRFNTTLPQVASHHLAEGVRHCRPGVAYWDSPVEVTLSNGNHFFLNQAKYRLPDGGLPSMPSAAKIEQLHAEGPASAIQDNSAAITLALSQQKLPSAPGPLLPDDWAAGGGVLAGALLAGGLKLRKR